MMEKLGKLEAVKEENVVLRERVNEDRLEKLKTENYFLSERVR